MPKNKKPARKAPPPPAPDRTDELIEDLAVLAAEVVEEAGAGAVPAKMDELQKMIRNALRKKQDEVLYGAIEHASYENPGAYVLLRGEIEEAAAAIVLRAENKPPTELTNTGTRKASKKRSRIRPVSSCCAPVYRRPGW